MSPQPKSVLQVSDLDIRVPGRSLVEGLSFDAGQGEFIAILGQNGCGKSLTMMTLGGLRDADGGSVRMHGDDVHTAPRQQVARSLALLPQRGDDLFPATVMETALAGRHPHVARFRWESSGDREITQEALDTVGIGGLADRDVMTLSGGERRRVAIAQVLAQQPSVFLLDEPTNHLDPQHQVDTLRVFRRKVETGATVIASLHDANLAMRFADRCLLLFGDGRWDLGPADDVLEAGRLSHLYATPIEAIPWRDSKVFVAAGLET